MKKIPFVLAAVAIFSLSGSAHAADQYSWKAAYIVKQGTGQISESLQGGPFATQDACYADNRDTPASAGAIGPQTSVGNGGFLCTCDTPIAQQGDACPGYTPPPAGSCGFANNFACPSGQTCSNGSCVPLPTATQSAAPSAPSGYVPVVTIPGLTDVNSTLVVNQGTLANFLNNLYKYLIGLAAILAVVEIMWGGILISTQRDSISAHSEGMKKIQHAIGGLVLVLLPALVFSIINPGILNLSVNIPALDTKAGTYVPSQHDVGSSSTTVSVGSNVTDRFTTCNQNNCSVAVRLCESATSYNLSTAQLSCWNPTTQKMDTSASPGTDQNNVTCPSGEQAAIVCTSQSINAGQ